MPAANPSTFSSSLSSALFDYGLIVSGPIIEDGQIQRCGTRKKPKGKNGWYIAYDNGEAAIFGNWETGDGYEYWRQDGAKEYRPADRSRIEKFKEQKEQSQLQSADEAVAFYESRAKEGFSDYLKTKRIYPYGARFDGNVLIIPCQDAAGKIWSYQKIYGDGSKYFMPGGKISGCYHAIFPDRNISRDELVVICEGFATGASIHQETGLPVIVAFNAGNLKPVCETVIFRNLLIAADNDKSGVGEKAAQETGYKYVMPRIEGADYNDLFLDGQDFKSDFEIKTEEDGRLIRVTGLVGEIADWITTTAIRPQPDLSLAAAIAFMGMVKSRRVKGRYNLRTNWYSLAMAPTGGGKDHPIYAIGRLTKACGLYDNLMGKPTSGTGLLTGLVKAKLAGLLVVDEIGRYMGNISQKGAGTHMREITDYFVELFSAAGRSFEGRQYANEKINPQVKFDQGHLSVLGYSVKEKLQAACSSSEIVDGFLNRWVLFSTDDRPTKQARGRDDTPPQAIVEKVKGWLAEFPIQMDSYGDLEPAVVSFTPEAQEIFNAFDDKMENSIASSCYPVDKLYTRSAEHVEKLAMILSDGGFIGVPETQQAIAIVERSNKALIRFCNMIADNISESDYVRVREKIKEAGEIKKSHLTMKCQFVQGGVKRISDIIKVLLDGNIISEKKDGNKTIYKWIG